MRIRGLGISGIKVHCKALLGKHLYRRPAQMHNSVPYISFTFDDFPRSALHAGGDILQKSGIRATYYASFGLMGTQAPPGPIFIQDDIRELTSKGHELGCHTFDHSHAWETNPYVFENSIIKNSVFLENHFPGASFKSLSYPIHGADPRVKRRAGAHFNCCRAGGQTFNSGTVDLLLLRGFFLEKCRGNLDLVKDIIDRNCRARGWLIFATHDISETPTLYGCTPSFLEDVVRCSMDSGSRLLPVAEALETMGIAGNVTSSVRDNGKHNQFNQGNLNE